MTYGFPNLSRLNFPGSVRARSPAVSRPWNVWISTGPKGRAGAGGAPPNALDGWRNARDARKAFLRAARRAGLVPAKTRFAAKPAWQR